MVVGTAGEVCDRDDANENAGEGAAGKRGENSDVAEVGVRVPWGALGARRRLVELRSLPRDWASTRPSELVLYRWEW